MNKKTDSNQFITKDYFENTLARLLGGMRNEITFAIEGAVEKISVEIHTANDSNLTRLDSIAKDLEEMREDKAFRYSPNISASTAS